MWPNPQFSPDLVKFTEEIHYGKLHFLGSVLKLVDDKCNLIPTNDYLKGFRKIYQEEIDNCYSDIDVLINWYWHSE